MRRDELLEVLLPAGVAIDKISAVMPVGAVLSISQDKEEFAYIGDFLLEDAQVQQIGQLLVSTMVELTGLVEVEVITLINDLSEVLIEAPDGDVGTRSGQFHFTITRDPRKIRFTEVAHVIASTLGSDQ